jgi:hypothetical protein
MMRRFSQQLRLRVTLERCCRLVAILATTLLPSIGAKIDVHLALLGGDDG